LKCQPLVPDAPHKAILIDEYFSRTKSSAVSLWPDANITLAIVMLVPRSTSARLVALHRFFEVSIGIAVGLALFAIWQKIDLRLSVRAKQASSVG
jgi:hypothetical protein